MGAMIKSGGCFNWSMPDGVKRAGNIAANNKGKIALGAFALAVIAGGLLAIHFTIGYPDFGNRFVTAMNTKVPLTMNVAQLSGAIGAALVGAVGLGALGYTACKRIQKKRKEKESADETNSNSDMSNDGTGEETTSPMRARKGVKLGGHAARGTRKERLAGARAALEADTAHFPPENNASGVERVHYRGRATFATEVFAEPGMYSERVIAAGVVPGGALETTMHPSGARATPAAGAAPGARAARLLGTATSEGSSGDSEGSEEE